MRCVYAHMMSSPVLPNLLSMEEVLKYFFYIPRNTVYERLQARKSSWWGKFLSLTVRRLCNNKKQTPTE